MGEKTEYGQFYHFETFTVVPIDTTPLKLEMMTNEEIEWLNAFNQHAYQTVAPHVSPRAEQWLKKANSPDSIVFSQTLSEKEGSDFFYGRTVRIWEKMRENK